MSINIESVVPAVLVIAIVWFFIDFIRYVNIRSRMSRAEQERLTFGRELPVPTRRLIYLVANALRPFVLAYRFWVVVLVLVFLILINMYFKQGPAP